MSPLRLGLIGAGSWGRNYIRTLQGLPGAVLARAASRNPETPRLVGPGCAVSSDWREVAGDRGLDGVIVASPPALHAPMARSAIEAGVPVLVEKPLALDPGEARGLLDLAGRKRSLVLVGHTHLYHPAYEALKERARAHGPVRGVVSAGGNWGPFRPDTPPLWDYGPHDVALCLDLLGRKPESVQAELEESREVEGRDGELWRLELAFEGGVLARIRVGNLMLSKHRRFEAHFARQALVFDDLSRDKLRLHVLEGGDLTGPGEAIPCADEPPLARLVRAFADAIRSGSRDLKSLELGVTVVEVLSRCRPAPPR